MVLASVSGCTVKSTKLFEGSPESVQAEWQPGDELYIQSPNGEIVVDAGSGDKVDAEVKPFVLLAHDATEEEARDELEKLKLTVGYDTLKSGGTRILIDLDRTGQHKSSLGGDLDVTIPSPFDGALRVDQTNGPTKVRDPGDASYVEVKSENGSCSVNAGSARNIDVSCDNGSLSGSVRQVPDDFSNAKFETGNGDIDLKFPGSGVYNVTAYSQGGGIVDVGNATSSGCSVNESSDSSKTISCGNATSEDPTYEVVAKGSLTHEIKLQF